MTKIKLCGMMRPQDIVYANEARPDYVGFILTAGFRRSVTKDEACRMKALLDPAIRAVGVFVNDTAENIQAFLQAGIIDLVQLHGCESPAFCKQIPAPVIKYFSPEAFEQTGQYDTDYFLFDSGTGTGKTFNWSEIPKTDTPFFLAGGLNAQNIQSAVKQVSPFAVDLSSAVETNGYKDKEKMINIVRSIRYE